MQHESELYTEVSSIKKQVTNMQQFLNDKEKERKNLTSDSKRYLIEQKIFLNRLIFT